MTSLIAGTTSRLIYKLIIVIFRRGQMLGEDIT